MTNSQIAQEAAEKITIDNIPEKFLEGGGYWYEMGAAFAIEKMLGFNEWVSVETPPTEFVSVYFSRPLIMFNGAQISSGYYDRGNGFWGNGQFMGFAGSKPTHWKYAPDPPGDNTAICKYLNLEP